MYNLNNDIISDDGTTTDGSEIEASECPSDPLLANCGSTPVQVKSPAEFYVPWCGVVFYAMAFTGLCSAWLLRACLSVVIVAMVNQTAVAEDVVITNASDDQCPQRPRTSTWKRRIQLEPKSAGHGVVSILLRSRSYSGVVHCMCTDSDQINKRSP